MVLAWKPGLSRVDDRTIGCDTWSVLRTNIILSITSKFESGNQEIEVRVMLFYIK